MMSEAAIAARYGRHVGWRSGSLTLDAIAAERGDGNRVLGRFSCDCGNVVTLPIGRTLKAKRTHCGCQTDHGTHRKHGMRGSPEYSSWMAMKRRCLDPNDKDFPRWGGKGITICQEWIDSFESFYAHIGPRPPGTTLDRYPDASGNYEPGNVRWATPTQQARNRRDFTIITTPLGKMPLIDYAKRIGITEGAAHQRLKRGKLEGCRRV